MEDNKKYIYTFNTFDWKIRECEILKETRYTWTTIYGNSYSKEVHSNWKPHCETVTFWSLDIDELKSFKKYELETRIKFLKKDIERFEGLLSQE